MNSDTRPLQLRRSAEDLHGRLQQALKAKQQTVAELLQLLGLWAQVCRDFWKKAFAPSASPGLKLWRILASSLVGAVSLSSESEGESLFVGEC